MNTKKLNIVTIVSLCLVLVISMFSVIPEADAATTNLKVTANSLNLRTAPNTSSKVLLSLKKNTTVTKLAKSGDWYQVKYKSTKGWASAKYLKTVASSVSTASITSKIVTSKVDNLNIRQSNSTTSKSVGKLNKGKTATYIQQKNGWVQIKTASLTGWVSASYVTISDKKVTESKPKITKAKENLYFVVTANSLSVRSEPSSSSTKLDHVNKNESLLISRIASNGWVEVTYQTGKKGWVSGKYGIQKVKEPTTSSITVVVPKETTYFYVTEPTGLTLRDNYSASAESLGQDVPFEAKVQILKQASNGWIYVNYNDVEGWINGSTYYGFATTANISFTAAKPSKTQYFVMKSSTLNVRSLPTTAAPTLGKVSKGNYFKILRISDNKWVEVQYNSKQKGWISANTSSSTITTKKPTSTVSDSVKGSLAGIKIVIDPGHGKQDNGASGNGVVEKKLNLQAAEAIQTAIEKVGGTVYMTRTTDNQFLTLDQRAAYAKQKGANAFISVHHNSGPSSASGYESYYSTSAKVSSKKFAEAIHAGIKEAVKDEYPNYGDRKLKAVDYYVVRYNSVVSVLLELGFVSNSSDAKLVNTDHYRETVAEGVVNGLLAYYGRD
ncbi:SH3 domain-containing protein [Rummeliibacillus pycnus]|uniref:SH3 domain-containing protein n=1 Tax=Rummeliibacillus pycnus TaxID=101070 RepID=UPI003D29A7BC